MTTTNDYTTGLVSKAGAPWQVLQWDGEGWNQVGPYYDTEAEAEAAIAALEAKREAFLAVHMQDNKAPLL